MNFKNKKLVIGLGTGRSGTASLARFLDAQKDSFFVHEGAYKHKTRMRFTSGDYLPWEVDISCFEKWYEGLFQASKSAQFYGDIGASILLYVPHILAKAPDTKFVCLQRPRHEVVESFLQLTKGINHWDKNNILRHFDFWDEMFPKIEASTKQEAIEKYWDLYYTIASDFQEKYPNAFRIFLIDDLNSQSGRMKILDHIKYPLAGRNTNVTYHLNKRVHPVLSFSLRILMYLYNKLIRRHIS